jgi:hypothetical protein
MNVDSIRLVWQVLKGFHLHVTFSGFQIVGRLCQDLACVRRRAKAQCFIMVIPCNY